MTLQDKVKLAIRDVPDFPKKGIVFKDITPILSDSQLCTEIVEEIAEQVKGLNLDAIACIDARGWLFGMMIANRLSIPFVPIRKAGKLPYDKFIEEYALEYGTDSIEMHQDAINKGDRVLIHDDLLATGGTAEAAAKLVARKGEVVGFSFVVNLSFLAGEQKLKKYSETVLSLIEY